MLTARGGCLRVWWLEQARSALELKQWVEILNKASESAIDMKKFAFLEAEAEKDAPGGDGDDGVEFLGGDAGDESKAPGGKAGATKAGAGATAEATSARTAAAAARAAEPATAKETPPAKPVSDAASRDSASLGRSGSDPDPVSSPGEARPGMAAGAAEEEASGAQEPTTGDGASSPGSDAAKSSKAAADDAGSDAGSDAGDDAGDDDDEDEGANANDDEGEDDDDDDDSDDGSDSGESSGDEGHAAEIEAAAAAAAAAAAKAEEEARIAAEEAKAKAEAEAKAAEEARLEAERRAKAEAEEAERVAAAKAAEAEALRNAPPAHPVTEQGTRIAEQAAQRAPVPAAQVQLPPPESSFNLGNARLSRYFSVDGMTYQEAEIASRVVPKSTRWGPRDGNKQFCEHPCTPQFPIRHFPAVERGSIHLALVLDRRPTVPPHLPTLNHWQHRECASCGDTITTGRFGTGEKAHYCFYTELLFCYRCFGHNLRRVPWRIVHSLDTNVFRVRGVRCVTHVRVGCGQSC